jgi:hypothetical protein
MSFRELVEQMDRAVMSVFGDPKPGEPEAIVYTPTVGPPVEVSGIFDENHALSRNERGDPVAATVRPVVFVQFEDLPVDAPLDPIDFANPTGPPAPVPRVTIRGLVYHVSWRLPDGMGGVMLVLSREP